MTDAFAKGMRTLSAVLVFIITGILSTFGAVDLTPVVRVFVQDPKVLGAVMIGIGILFGWLRYITTTPLFKTDVVPKRVDAGV